MRYAKALWRRGLALCLALLMTFGAAFAAEPEKDRTAARQEDLDFLYEKVLKGSHPNAFANTPESEFLALKQEIASRLDMESDVEFLLDLMRLTALVRDSHTSLSISDGAMFRGYPFSLIRRGDSWYLSAIAAKDKSLLGREITALAGRPVEEVITAFGQIFGSDNPVHLQRQFRQACMVADIYEYLGLVEAGKPLTVTLAGNKTLSLAPIDMESLNSLDVARLADRITETPATAAANAYYFSMPLTDSTFYIQYNTCREAEDLSMEEFAASVEEALDAGDYARLVLDLRNNGGGSDGVIWPIFSMVRTRRLLKGDDIEFVGLIGERTFSSALINAVEIQEMGGVLVGEPAGGSVCHFGAVRTFSLPNSKVRGQFSTKYIDLNTLLDAGAGRGVEALEPDIKVSQTLEDTLAGKDTAVEWLLAHPEKLSQKEYPDAPLTRGRFIGMLHQAAGDVDVPVEDLPFTDLLDGIEWYLPGLIWAKTFGIAGGYADGTFAASRPITWRETVAFLSRTAKYLHHNTLPALRTTPVPEALAEIANPEDAALVWRLGYIPEDADFSQGPDRAVGKAMARAVADLS